MRLIPDSGVVFSSTIVLGPKARDSKAQANGLGLCLWGRTSPQVAGLDCGIAALQAETPNLFMDSFYVMNPESKLIDQIIDIIGRI